jgi:hypothetical protein
MKTDLIRSGKVNEWRGFVAHAAMSSSATAIGEGGYDQDDGIRGVCAETERWFSYATNDQTRRKLLDWVVIGRRRFCIVCGSEKQGHVCDDVVGLYGDPCALTDQSFVTIAGQEQSTEHCLTNQQMMLLFFYD